MRFRTVRLRRVVTGAIFVRDRFYHLSTKVDVSASPTSCRPKLCGRYVGRVSWNRVRASDRPSFRSGMTDFEKALEENEAVEVSVGKHYKTIVDKEDFEKFKKYTWTIRYADKKKTHPYVDIRSRKYKIRQMLHRLIMSAPVGKMVDHINGNTLDNRKINLRFTSASENSRNLTRLRQNKTSKYLGVSLTRNNKWTAQICVDGKTTNLGSFNSEHTASIVRDLKALTLGYDIITTNTHPDIINYIKSWAREFTVREVCDYLKSLEDKYFYSCEGGISPIKWADIVKQHFKDRGGEDER